MKRIKTVLKNAPWDDPATLRIEEGSPEWTAAYLNWLDGRNPTDDPGWKRGVFLGFLVVGKDE